MKSIKETLFHNYLLYLIKSLKIYCLFEVLEPVAFEKLNLDETILLKFRESFGKINTNSTKDLKRVRWSGFIYLLGCNNLKAFCKNLEKILKVTPNIIFYHFYFQGTKMVINEFLFLLVNKFNINLRLLQLVSFYRIVHVLYFSLFKKVNNLLLLNTCQH